MVSMATGVWNFFVSVTRILLGYIFIHLRSLMSTIATITESEQKVCFKLKSLHSQNRKKSVAMVTATEPISIFPV